MNAKLEGAGHLAAQLDTRYSFTAQFLAASAMHSQMAFDIENKPTAEVSDVDRIAHRGFVVSAIMQAAAALESEVWETTHHGPGHHLGSNDRDQQSIEFLQPLAEIIDGERSLERFSIVLHLLRKEPMMSGEQPWQDASLVVRLRNEVVHYKSYWGEELDRIGLLKALQAKKFSRPPFIPAEGMNYFPHHCLSASCAAWSLESCVKFIDVFYQRLGISSPLDGQRQFLDAPGVQRRVQG